MGLIRYAAKRDANEAEIVATLERMGCHVEQISGPGLPDLLVSRAGRWYVAEIKAPKGRKTKAQEKFSEAARAHVEILRSVEDAAEWVGAMPW